MNGDSRAAADEYIAHLAENVDVTESAWSKFTELFKKFLKAIGLEQKITDADIANTIKKSYQRLLEGGASEGAAGEGTRFSAKKKRALETASVSRGKHQPTVVSSADGANILNNLDNLAKEYEEKSSQSKTFLGDVANAIGARKQGSGSQYATFETVNGNVVTIRLADHNATVSNFDNRDENEGISIVVSAKDNNGITNVGDAHIVEYFYDSIDLRRADGKPLAEIVKSIKQSLYSGEFKDTTGLAERQEVNESRFRIKKIQEEYDVPSELFDYYEDSIKLGNLSGASQALIGIKRFIRMNIGPKLSEFVSVYKDNRYVIFEELGNLDELRQKHEQQAIEQADLMEAARKRAEEEAKRERQKAKELELLSDEALDKEYLNALDEENVSRAKDFVSEAARRKGYLITDYKDSHMSPVAQIERGDFTNLPALRKLQEDGFDLNLYAIAHGISSQPDDYFD